MSEDVLVRNSSPTLAGLKTGSLFNLTFQSLYEMNICIQGWNQILSRKGLQACPLRIRGTRALIYVYRPSWLARDLQSPDSFMLLQQYGYCPMFPEQCLSRLKERLSSEDEFPHEIGLFLGYPPEDVRGFIRDANGQKYTGMWKVYGNVKKAQRLFEKYKRCTAVYCRQYYSGVPLERLAVAG